MKNFHYLLSSSHSIIDERGQILALAAQLAEPELSTEARLVIAAQIRLVLLGEITDSLSSEFVMNINRIVPLEHPPPIITCSGN